MSYCRWSSDDFQCDIYCYCGGDYIIHITADGKPLKFPRGNIIKIAP